MTAPGAEDLPKIGPAAINAQIPIRGAAYVDPDWNRLTEVRIAGQEWAGDLATATVSATMSYSATQIGQVTLVLQDSWDGAIIGAGLIKRGASLDWGDQHCVISGRSMRRGEVGPQFTVRAKSRVIDVLTKGEHRGKGSWGEQEFGTWLVDRAKEAGATWFIQPDMGTVALARTADDDTTWAAAQRAAQTVGAWCFEYENKIVCGRPTWLSDTARSRVWPLEYFSPDNYTNGLTGMPSWDESDSGETLSFSLISKDAESIRPGERVTMGGNFGHGTGDWIVTQVNVPAKITAAVDVTCARIVDPAPQKTGALG